MDPNFVQRPPYPQRSLPADSHPFNRRALFITGNVLGLGFLGYLLMSLLYSIIVGRVDRLYDMYVNDTLYSYLLEILYSYMCVGLPFLAVFIVLKRTRRYRDLVLPYGAPYKTGEAVLLVFAALGVCFLGSIAANYIAAYADAFGFGFLSYYEMLEPEPVPAGLTGAVVLVLRSALIPALLEEFAFRGVVLQSLRRYGDWFAIVSSAVLFGLVHGKMTQIPFAVIAGVAMGYCAVVTGSLRPGIAVHFMNNFVSVIVTLASARLGEGASVMISNVLVYAFIGLGLVMLVIYLLRKPNAMRLRPARDPSLRGKGRALFLAPVLLIAVLWLGWYALCDISAFAEWLGVV